MIFPRELRVGVNLSELSNWEQVMPLSAATPLNPAYFLDRAAKIFLERTAIIDGERRFSYHEFGERAHRLAGTLRGIGAQNGDRIAALCTNSHVMLEMHNGVPMAGCALVPMNIRLSNKSWLTSSKIPAPAF